MTAAPTDEAVPAAGGDAADAAAAEGRRRQSRRALRADGILAAVTTVLTGIPTAIMWVLLANGTALHWAFCALVAAVFGAALPLVLPTTSRDVMRAGPDPERLRAAARAVVESVGGLG